MTTPHILIAAGGTGGHVFPAIAIAEQLLMSKAKVSWLATGGREMSYLEGHDFSVFVVPFSSVRGLKLLMKLPLAVLRAYLLIRRLRPQVVLCMGGYPAVPGALAARILGIPLVLHEQNAVAGLANRLLKKIAKRTLGGFSDVFGELVGNPVREEFFAYPPPQQRYDKRQGALHILVLGGSQGAAILNDITPAALRLLPEPRPTVVHQCGVARGDEVSDTYKKNGVDASVCEFIKEVAAEMAKADLVISRAGASTLSELSALGVASLLVPYPYAANQHQSVNAQAMAKRGASQYFEENIMDAKKLAEFLCNMTRDDCLTMAQKVWQLAQPKAAALVAEHCLSEACHAT